MSMPTTPTIFAGLVVVLVPVIMLVLWRRRPRLPSHTPTVVPPERERTPTPLDVSTADTVPTAPDRKATPTGKRG